MERRTPADSSPRRSRSISRRSFVAVSGTALAGSAFFQGEIANAAAASVPQSLGSLDLSSFKKYTGRLFRVRHESGQSVFKLVSAERSGAAVKDLKLARECFMLRFRRVQGAAVPQGSYTLSNPSLGRFPLFVVPNGDPREERYTAVINRDRGQ